MSLNLNSLTVTNAINGSITGNAATVTTNANLTGDVTSTGNATSIAANAVVTAKISNNNVTYAKLQQVAGLSVVGNSTNSTANAANITGSANQVLRVSNDGTALAFGPVNLADIQAVTGTLPVSRGGTGGTTQATARTNGIGATTVGSNLITLADPGATRFIRINSDNTISALNDTDFRNAIGAGTGGGGVTSVTGTAPIASSGGATPAISLNDAGVTYAKIQNVSVTSRVLGRITAGAGVIEELTGANIAQIIGANTITNATNATNATTAANVSAVADAAIVNQHNGNSAAWYGRILSKNSTSDKASFIGTYGSIAGVFAHNNALSAWADLYINTVDGSGGGTVRLPATVLLNGNQVLTTASTLSTANLSGTVTVSNGGTGATTFTAGRVLFGNGTSAINTSANLFWDNTNNRLGIGTSPASPYTLDVNGTIHYTSLTASSDVRFKKNVEVISNPLNRLSSVRGVKFEWNEFVNARRGGYELNKPTFGVIAQELEEVFPELVSHWKLSDDCPDARSVNYEKIIPVLIEAVKELDNKNKLLEARVLALENK